MEKENQYKKLLEEAAWYADPDFDYKIEVKDEAPNNVLVARGKISIKNNSDKTQFTYNFAIGVDRNILFSHQGRSKETENGYLVGIDLKKRVHESIIEFNEKLAKSVGAKRIMISDEESERVRQLYLSRGYDIKPSLEDNPYKTLEKRLQ